MKRLILWIICITFCFSAMAQYNGPARAVKLETNFIASLTFSYDRIIPVSDYVGWMIGCNYIMGVGFGHGSHWLAPGSSLLLFGPRHFLETGVFYAWEMFPESIQNRENSLGFELGYRYIVGNTLTLYLTGNVYPNIDPIFVPSLGFGFSF